MRRDRVLEIIMKCRFFTCVSAASLVLCGALLVLWVRSYWFWDRVTYGTAATNEGQYAGGYISNIFGDLNLTVWIRQDPKAKGQAGGGKWLSGRNTRKLEVYKSGRQSYMKSIGATGMLGFWLSARKYSPNAGRSPNPGGRAPLPLQPTWIISVPYWLLILLTALLPAIWFYRWWRHPPAGHCSVCGYDLRASKDRCPECGMLITSSPHKPIRLMGERA
jgi:hypothetical protein